MANEIQTSFSFTLTKGNHVEQIEVQQRLDSQTGVGAHKPVVEVGTAEEVLSFGDVTTPGFLFFRNLDETNYVDIGPESAGAMVPLCRVNPGQWGYVPLHPSTVLRAKADTASVKLLLLVTEA